MCQVTHCQADLTQSKRYNRRYSLCENCMRSSAILVQGREMRFCQQCSCLHPVSNFDGKKRSCRMQLTKHKIKRAKALMLKQKK